MTEIKDLLQMSSHAYDATLPEKSVGMYMPLMFGRDSVFLVGRTGFRAHAYYSQDKNTLVVAYAGTNDSIDLRTDFQLAVNGASNQDYRALQFAREAEDKLLSMGVADYAEQNSHVVLNDPLGGF